MITVTCTVASFTPPSAPTPGPSYDIFNPALTVKVEGSYEQVPACGYTFTSVYAYTVVDNGGCQGAIGAGTVPADEPSFVA